MLVSFSCRFFMLCYAPPGSPQPESGALRALTVPCGSLQFSTFCSEMLGKGPRTATDFLREGPATHARIAPQAQHLIQLTWGGAFTLRLHCPMFLQWLVAGRAHCRGTQQPFPPFSTAAGPTPALPYQWLWCVSCRAACSWTQKLPHQLQRPLNRCCPWPLHCQTLPHQLQWPHKQAPAHQQSTRLSCGRSWVQVPLLM